VEQQIGHLRAQLLRSEQDNELMRIKLEQETAEREKAQKQVCMLVESVHAVYTANIVIRHQPSHHG